MSTAPATPSNAQRTHDEYGQSIWYDNVQRKLLRSGHFKDLVAAGVRGCTSNPTIFEKAIAGSTDYEAALQRLVAEGQSAEQIYLALVKEDIRDTADILRPIYDASQGADGYVSVEVSPELARDTEATVTEAQHLHRLIERPNLMIKIPATAQGLPAMTRTIAAGISVNVTLIFSVEQYRQVALAYLEGLELAAKAGVDLSRIASVASFFISRIDSAVDAQLKTKGERANALLGKAAIANAKQAYALFKELFSSPRFTALRKAGARPQRVLWASTGTKNPAYPDTLYVDELIGPDTVNTVPPQTLDAFQDHGKPRASLEQGQADAQRVIDDLKQLGIPLEPVCQKLLDEGVTAFSKSMTSLMDVIANRRQLLLNASMANQTFSLGQANQVVNDALSELDKGHAAQRLWNKERALFTADASHDDSVRTRLGWLRSPQLMHENIARLQAFAREVQQAGFKKALLLGMGGSSLCPEVLATTFGTRAGTLDLRVLDSTDPEAVKAAEQWADLEHTLFIVSSKSGSTIEVASFLAYFWQLTQKRYGAQAGSRFIAITDPGTLLASIAAKNSYRAVFENPADIGGRYSAVSYFGMVPAALLGIDLPAFIGSAVHMTQSCAAAVPSRDNPGLSLGAFIGAAAKNGRDKLTLIASPEFASLGSWIEQLVAESTGKLGKGVVPVDLEPRTETEAGSDRAFVYVRYDANPTTDLDTQIERLSSQGHPVATIRLKDRTDIGGEFVRWEMATAFASAVLGVNPFDEPDVSAAKKATAEFIAQFEQAGSLSFPGWVQSGDAQISETLRKAKAGVDYVTLSAFFARTDERDQLLNQVRALIGAKLGCATTLGYGPRFLHSTGQLHKGGGNNGVFLLLRSGITQDLSIPEQRYSFGTLRDAQALGDQKVLLERKRRAVAVNLGENVVQDLAHLLEGLKKSL